MRQLSVLSPRSMVGGRRRNPRARRGADVKIGPAAKSFLFPDVGIVVRDRMVPPDTRLAGNVPCLETGARRGQHLALDSRALIRGFRSPALFDGVARRRGRRSKASQGGNRGEEGRCWGATYGDLRVADGWRATRREPAAFRLGGGTGDGGRFRSRNCAGVSRCRRSGKDCGHRAHIGFMFRRGAGGESDRQCEAGRMATVMRCRS